MAGDLLPETLGFLTDAAHLLSSASPATSAHLMSQRNSLMFHNDLDLSDVQRQHVCGCCGHILIPGRGDMLKIDSLKIARGKKRSKAGKKETKPISSEPGYGCRKTFTCGRCGRYTQIQLPRPASLPKRRLKQTLKTAAVNAELKGSVSTVPASKTTGSTTGLASSTDASVKSSANASSKKRAKNRKQGLQALLQQSSSSKPQGGLGLSLADFMQN